ncbi:hypothetical protein EW146_g8173 [Bondarzewia mesenterica]|uniref:Uncharacterized protein n=1 Tax=Bondarzewia mesenterica TaxID=1095465 RepID=A0A4S4LH51_9AGAM|nr:hypothetical protein EW146_g8173 [Bondarzewia mesenterica]
MSHSPPPPTAPSASGQARSEQGDRNMLFSFTPTPMVFPTVYFPATSSKPDAPAIRQMKFEGITWRVTQQHIQEQRLTLRMLKLQEQEEELRLREAEQHIGSIRHSMEWYSISRVSDDEDEALSEDSTPSDAEADQCIVYHVPELASLCISSFRQLHDDIERKHGLTSRVLIYGFVVCPLVFSLTSFFCTMTSTPGSSSTMSSPVNEQSLSARTLLSTADFNLYDSGLRDRVVWFRETQGDVLVLRPTDKDDARSSPVSASLGCIVDIDYDNYWLTSDAHYTGQGTYPQPFDKAKPTCYVKQSTNPAYADDFTNVVQNLCYLQDIMERKAKSNDYSGYLDLKKVTAEEKRESVGLRHEFTTAGWPVETDAAKRQLESIQSTHRVNPIPAYDSDSNLIRPSMYRETLARATVALCIRLLHYTIKRIIPKAPTTFTDFFVADIEKIRVVSAPISVTSRKRMLAMTDPSSISERVFEKRRKSP